MAESSPSEFDNEYDHDIRKLQSTSSSTKVNIFQKLQEAFIAALFGLILICIAPILIWKNEGRHVRELKRIDYCKNEAIAVNCDAPEEDMVNQLVHFSGQVKVIDSDVEEGSGGLAFGNGTSDSLNVTSPIQNAIMMKRTCYIYQKFEESKTEVRRNTVGGGETRTTTYSVRHAWTNDGPQQRYLEHLPNEENSRGIWDQLVSQSGGGNDDSMNVAGSESLSAAMNALAAANSNKPPHAIQVTSSANVGEYLLSRDIIISNAHEFYPEPIPIPSEYLPDTVEGCDGLIKGSDHILRTFDENEEPQNGDVKVVYEYATDQFDCSFIVKQTNVPEGERRPLLNEFDSSPAKYGVDKAEVTDEKCFGKCNDDLGEIWMVRRGIHDLDEMIVMATDDENTMTMVIRVVGYAMLLGGWCMLFSPFTTALQVLPFLSTIGGFAVFLTGLIVSCMCCCTVMTAAYIRYRPLLAIALLVVAGGIWGVIVWRLEVAAEEGGGDDDAASVTPAY